jgi:RNA polymerase sigma factor (TIGR02999 family)
VEKNDVTQLLLGWSNGDRSVLDRLTPILYDELRRLAASHLRRGFPSDTIQPTSLVHEAYLRLAHQDDLSFQNRAQFFGLAAQVMRTILVDHARSKAAAKRGAGGGEITLRDDMASSAQSSADVLELHDALEALSKQDQRKASIIEMRYFGGMTATEISEALNISVATVGRELRVAQAWLLRRMRQ